METRMEKRKKRRREGRLRFYKLLILCFSLVLLLMGIRIVNKNIIQLGYLKNPKIFNLDLRRSKLDLFGDTYLLDFRVIKKLP